MWDLGSISLFYYLAYSSTVRYGSLVGRYL
jgi:hypothetical protein